MSMSEVMTLVIHVHQAGYRNLKHYYFRGRLESPS